MAWMVPAVMAAAPVAFLCFAASLAAQPTASPQAAKQMVPDNPSEHAPPVQPVPYSHKKHLSLGLDCKDCHTNPEPGKLMSFPDTGKCLLCHAASAKDNPAIQKLAPVS